MRRRAVSRYDLQVRTRRQTEQTTHRRADRSRRRKKIALCAAMFVVLLIAAAPSLVSHSPIGRSLIAENLAQYGWVAEVERVQLGWVTALHLTNLELTGERAGSTIAVGEVQTTLTLPGLLSSQLARGRFGEIFLRDVQVTCGVESGSSTIERDLTDLLEPSDPPQEIQPEGSLQIQGLRVDVTDLATVSTWSLKQSNASIEIDAEAWTTTWQGVLSQPGGGEGSLQGEAVVSGTPGENAATSLQMEADSLPLSVLSLVARRLPDSKLPAEITGDLTGSAFVDLPPSGYPRVSLHQIELRGLAAYDPATETRLWSNELTLLDGEWTWQPGRIVARHVSAKTDFATVSINGTFSDSISLAGAGSNPLAWLDQVDATADVAIDLPRLQAAMPSVLPLRRSATLHRGTIHATIEPLPDHDVAAGQARSRRRRLVIHTDTIEATAQGKAVAIAPMDATAIVASDAATLAAERFELNSPFARVDGQGSLASGAAELNVDFGKLVQMLQPLFELDQQDLQGDVTTTVRWDAEPGGLWRLRGNSRIDHLMVQFDADRRLRQSQLTSTLDIEGRWSSSAGSWSLDELSRGSLRVQSDGVQTDVQLVQAVQAPNRERMLPLQIHAEGRVESIHEMLHPWVPDLPADIQGGFDTSASVQINGAGDVLLQSMEGQLRGLQVPLDDQLISQDVVKVEFQGKALWPRQELTIRALSINGDAISAAVKGQWINDMTDLDVVWDVDLDRLQATATQRIARQPQEHHAAHGAGYEHPLSNRETGSHIQTVGFTQNLSTASGPWSVGGKIAGNTIIVGDRQTLHCQTRITGRDLKLHERVAGANPPQTSLIWSEPALKIEGQFEFQPPAQKLATESLQISSDWCAATLAGAVSWQDAATDVQLRGPARFKMDEVASHLSRLSGVPIQAEGLHETQLELLYAQHAPDEYAFSIQGTLGWETVDTAGMLFGPSEVPFRMTEDVVSIAPSRIPVLGASRLSTPMIGPQVPPLTDTPSPSPSGEILIAGDVHYRPELCVELRPGPIARDVQLTPEMTSQWLKYMAPIAADAARVEGTFHADIEHAVVWIDDPRRSEVRGRLDIERVQMNAGPLADQVIAGARQLQALAALGNTTQPPQTGRTLITLPAQSVEFHVSQGAVTHRAMLLDIDRARVVTSGQVDFDGRLDLIAQIPLDAKWLGSDLRGLAGQTLTLPIDGTLNRPSLDSDGIRRVAADFGVKAAQDAAGNYLQQQFGRGQQQLEQGINKGLEKLRFDNLFGN
ncbi:translocation/assembly module TamB domain-containing protein [Allorhodopirellula solitaria]|uniref:AsmA-like C-terminal domain-containing protein n=1 Tax=Allorhodopirellula solitaria TaxID=2527987 RepID=A0A5C5YK22_9BACT|nr:hypothetical protein [Allorhodopirellula solitaria]TWT75255.1 hypothetical protein CA85_05440 [Allorhodopirellula solitaria]